MSWARAVAVVFLWTLLSGTGWGADMRLGLAGSAEYDSNVLRTPVDEKDDGVFRIIPKVSFIEDEGKFQWDLRYRMPWETAIETRRAQGLRHLLDVAARHYVSQHTQVFLNDGFKYSEAVSSVSELDEMGAPSVGTFRTPVLRNGATLGVQHSFTPRLQGNFAFSHRLFESDVPRRSDNMVYVGNTNLNYALSSRHRLGGGAAATFQDLEASTDESIPPSQAFFLNVYGSWTWTIDETMSFQLTGGPTFVKNNQDAPAPVLERLVFPYFESGGNIFVLPLARCGQVNGLPVLELCREYARVPEADEGTITGAGSQTVTFQEGAPGGGRPSSQSATNWTFFGEAALSKRWSPRLVSRLMYRRTEDTASGTGSATLDLVSVTTNWQISELWDAGLRADFTRRESAAPSYQTYTVVQGYMLGSTQIAQTIPDTDVTQTGLTSRKVTRALDTDRWGVAVRMSRRITKHMRASLRYSYNEQTSKDNSLGYSSDFSNHLVTLGVQYDLDRWHLW